MLLFVKRYIQEKVHEFASQATEKAEKRTEETDFTTADSAAIQSGNFIYSILKHSIH